jgi:arginyl-tRNA synthetase
LKHKLQALLRQAIASLLDSGELHIQVPSSVPVERCRERSHGDFASPVALALAKKARQKPRAVAELLVTRLSPSTDIERVEVAGPGYINFTLTAEAYRSQLRDILEQGCEYGRSDLGAGRRVHIEFVSANPTGPLHVGHGRGAAYGAAVAELLNAVGFDIQREYYVNDAGRQMDILALSVWLRYLQHRGASVTFPANAYHGQYVADIAAQLEVERGDQFSIPPGAASAASDESSGNAEEELDSLIVQAKATLGETRYRVILDYALNELLADIRSDLEEFGVHFDVWFRERSLVDEGTLGRAIEQLQNGGHLYENAGATWFRSSAFGDEKDRVTIRENGQPTYFATDIAYHLCKLERGFEQLFDIWGADHHGYVARMQAALQALGANSDCLRVLLVQFASLYRGGEKVQMSTRSGEFVTLRQLRDEVGNDAARFFYVMRKSEQHLDFDLDLAKSQSSDNPVYYVQYAHARICSVMRELRARGHSWQAAESYRALGQLTQGHELELLRTLVRYPEVVESAAFAYEPHQLAFFLRDLANHFHTYYNAHKLLVADAQVRDARVALAVATRQVIRNGLGLLGVSAPESM